MTTLVYSHPSFLEHRTPPGHPERPDRLRAIERVLCDPAFDGLARVDAPPGDMEDILRVHPEDYVEAIRRASPLEGLVRIDADTTMSPGSWEAALRAVGAACDAVDEVTARRAANAFVAGRPPGHHAETERAMGFCLFNTAAVAARRAQAKHGAERVAIIDFDVHHGNGTQEIFWRDASVLYASTHQMPLYPGTGSPGETGAGNIVNVPLEAGDGGAAFRAAFGEVILPRLHDFAPDFVIVSAGFDAHRRDPLGGLALVESDFAWVTEQLMEVARRHAGGRLVSVLEGGYDLEGLSRSVGAHVRCLMGA